VLNRETNTVNYLLRCTEYVPDEDITRLSNAVPHQATRAAPYPTIDYYVFTVSTNSVRAQFEILNPNNDVDLIARKGSPLPDPGHFDFQSANPASRDELIMVFTNSTPVPLTSGDWYLGVVHRVTNQLTYTIVATEYSQLGDSLRITRYDLGSNTMVLTWTNMLLGVNYHLQSAPALAPTNWKAITETIRAGKTGTNYTMTWPYGPESCFFRVAEGLSPLVRATNFQARLTVTLNTTAQPVLSWTAPTNHACALQWSATLSAGSWLPITNGITATNGNYFFIDDGSQTGGPKRFYRLEMEVINPPVIPSPGRQP
jgi:hypothetical protein